MPEKEWMIYREDAIRDRKRDWRETGVKKPFDERDNVYRMCFDEREHRLTWPGRPEAVVGAQYVKERYIFERRRPFLWSRLPVDPVDEIKSCMTAQDALMEIGEKILAAVREVFVAGNEGESMESISRLVRAKIEGLDIQGMVRAVNTVLVPNGPQGASNFGFSGFNLAIAGNRVVVRLEKDAEAKYFLEIGDVTLAEE